MNERKKFKIHGEENSQSLTVYENGKAKKVNKSKKRKTSKLRRKPY